jgi:protein TonB
MKPGGDISRFGHKVAVGLGAVVGLSALLAAKVSADPQAPAPTAAAVPSTAPCDPPPPASDNQPLRIKRIPDDRLAASLYPPRAFRMGMAGQVTLRCLVTAKATLVRCDVVSETPAGMGFGEAAKKVAKHLAFAPVIKDGAPVACGAYVFSYDWRPPREL